MNEPSQNPDLVASSAVRRARTLTALPEAAANAGRVAEDPESTIEELRDAFSKDAALCSNLLKVANSALYGLRAEVSSIDRAAVVLGRKVLRNVALAASMQTILPKAEIHRSFSVNDLWRHSIRVAAAASILAKSSGAWDPEQAFAAGLVHDLGLLVEIETNHEILATILNEVSLANPNTQSDVIRKLELEFYGADHQHFGTAMCKAWGFPQALADVAAHHHNPLALDSEHRTLAAIVYLAEEIESTAEHGIVNNRDRIEIDPELLACLNLTPESFEDLVESMVQAADEVEAAF